MPRVTEGQVKEIISTDLSDITAYITAANLIVTDRLGSTTTLGSAILIEIERWLTAHLIAITQEPESQVKAEKIGDASINYARGELGKSLEATFYGQQVILLDSTGLMAQSGKVKATMRIIKSSSYTGESA